MKNRIKNIYVNWDPLLEVKKIVSSSIDFICVDFPDVDNQENEFNMKNYKDYLFYFLCLCYTNIKSNGNIVLFFNKKYISWIGDVLKKFPLFTYKWPIFITNEWENMKNNIVKSCYDVGYWMVEDDMNNLNIDYKLERYWMISKENNKQSVIESLIINFTKQGDLILNWFSWPKEVWKFCSDQWRHCISIITKKY